MADRMQWKKLLSTIRIRRMMGGTESRRDAHDYRSEFQRDYDRTIFSSPVRRLQEKAQVFPMDPSDAVRTRLTHSMEVSSVARDMARELGMWLLRSKEINDYEHVRAIEDIAATAAIIHDIGNPPFGHSGEVAIQDWFKDNGCGKMALKGLASEPNAEQLQGDFKRFEGNAQTLRLITRLQLLNDYFGLNLTAATVSAACKYVASSNNDNKMNYAELKKPGYFASENDLIQKLRGETGTGEARNPVTYIVEAADDIVYGFVDIEDAIKKRVIRWSDVVDYLNAAVTAGRVDGDQVKGLLNSVDSRVNEAAKTLQYVDRDHIAAQWLRTIGAGQTSRATINSFKTHYDSIMHGDFHQALIEVSDECRLLTTCQSLTRDLVFKHEETLRREMAGKQVIHDLLSLFWSYIHNYDGGDVKTKDFKGKMVLLMSSNYRSVLSHQLKSPDLPQTYSRLQLITDYICGMTDEFATHLHRELFNG